MRSRHTDCVFFAVQRGPRRKVPRGKRRRSSFFAEWAYLSVFYRSWHGQICRLEAEGRTAGADIPAYLACVSVYVYIARSLLYTQLLQHTASRSGVRMTGQPVSAFCLRTCLPAPVFFALAAGTAFLQYTRALLHPVRPFPPRPTHPASGAGTGGAPGAGWTGCDFRFAPPPEKATGENGKAAKPVCPPPPAWTVRGTPALTTHISPRRADFRVFRQAFLQKGRQPRAAAPCVAPPTRTCMPCNYAFPRTAVPACPAVPVPAPLRCPPTPRFLFSHLSSACNIRNIRRGFRVRRRNGRGAGRGMDRL